MNIMRVVRDDVEFYTIIETGESGMSVSGVARLCNIHFSSVQDLLKSILAGKTRSKWLKDLSEKDLYLRVNSIHNATILSAQACTALIGYYAFDARRKTKEAAFAFMKFGYIGMTQWIQTITGWEPKPALPEAHQPQAEIIAVEPEEISIEQLEKLVQRITPAKSIPTAINPEEVIDMLQNCGFSGAGYRLYLYLEMRQLQGLQPDITTICEEAQISHNTFYKLLPRIKELPRAQCQCHLRAVLTFVNDLSFQIGEILKNEILYHLLPMASRSYYIDRKLQHTTVLFFVLLPVFRRLLGSN